MDKVDFTTRSSILRVAALINVAALLLTLFFTKMGYSAEIKYIGAPGFECPECHRDISKACVLSGSIEKGDFDKLKEKIGHRTSAYKDRVLCDVLYLDSPGGSFLEAVLIMDSIHESMIITGVRKGDVCLSACAIIWLGGARPGGHSLDNPRADRRLWPGGTIGFHAPYPQLNKGDYSSEQVMKAFLGAFSLSQDLLKIYSRRRIPLWFAAKLMQPRISDFYYIDDVEAASLVGANVMVDLKSHSFPSHNERATACYNISYWSKNLSAKGKNEASFSNNESNFKTLDEYLNFFNLNYLTQLPHKYLMSIEIELNSVGLLPDKLNYNYDVSEIFQSIPSDELTARNVYQLLAQFLGPRFSYEAPGVLVYTGDRKNFKDPWRLFIGPGVVGPHDENIRDRGDICIIEERKSNESSVSFYGSDIDGYLSQWIIHLNGSLLGLPASTKLTALTQERSRSVSRHPKPSWCAKAGTVVEITICNDAELSALENEYVKVFDEKRSLNSNAAKQIARNVISARNGCGSDRSCIAAIYVRGIERLGGL